MQEITFDFKNRWILIYTESQETSEDMWNLIQKSMIKEFVPDLEMYMRGDNFTLDFEKNTVRVNKSVDWYRTEPYTRGFVVPIEERPVENLKYYWDTIIKRMGYVNIDYDLVDDYKDTVSFLTGIIGLEE